MVWSAVDQPRDSYMLWKLFNYPTVNGPRRAFAVPDTVGDQLNSAYTLMLKMLMAHFWSIIIGLVLYLFLHHQSKAHSLAATLWNKKDDLLGSLWETALGAFNSTQKEEQDIEEEPAPQADPKAKEGGDGWIFGVLVLIMLAWVGETALNVLVPRYIILGKAGPVNPDFMYSPDISNLSPALIAQRYALNAPWSLRAAGSALVANETLDERVNVTAYPQFKNANGDPMQRVDYAYNVTGVDLGLQNYPDLELRVAGSCVTEYGWLAGSSSPLVLGRPMNIDSYYDFGNRSNVPKYNVSLFDGRQPSASFNPAENIIQGTLPGSNRTWAAYISSVDRLSFSPGTDPWYLTDNAGGGSRTGAGYVVLKGRPALSCWEDSVWFYDGHSNNIDNLNETGLPGLSLSSNVQTILKNGLRYPMIQAIGRNLGPSALASSAGALEQLFDAQGSSILNDMKRLVLSSFIATANILTDSTLFPPQGRSNNALAKGGDSDFVVWSSEVAALSLVTTVTIPVLLVTVWIISMVLLRNSCLRRVEGFDSSKMYHHIQKKDPGAIPHYNQQKRHHWKLGHQKVPTTDSVDPPAEPVLTEKNTTNEDVKSL